MAKTARRSGHRPKYSSQNFFRTYQNVGWGFEIFKIGPEMANLGQINFTDYKAFALVWDSNGKEALAVFVKSVYV